MPGKRKHSIFKEMYEIRKSHSVKIGLTGISLLLLSLLAREIIPIHQPTGIWHVLNIIIELLGKAGEACILSGFVVYVLEGHSLAFIVKDVSRSIIDEIIDRHFSRKELIEFIFRGIKSLNKYEHIDDEIYDLYKKHGLLELTDEPHRSNASILLKKEGEVEGEKDKMFLNRIYDYRAMNEACEGGNMKLINKDGLVAFFDTSIPDISADTENEILKHIKKYFDIEFKFSTSFEISGSMCNKILLSLVPVVLSKDDFDVENCRPRTCGSESKEFKPELYAVYDIFSQIDTNKVLKLKLYFNVRIPPGEFTDLCFSVKGVVSDYELWTYEFISYTKGVTFELQLGDDFETKIEEVLIGVKNSPIKSNSKLKYNGWILPHSSISVTWRRRV